MTTEHENEGTSGGSALTDLLCISSDFLRLKPCPFCGAEAEIIKIEGETDDPSIGAQCVQCKSSACGAASGLIYPLMDDVTDLLQERWNKRSEESAMPRFDVEAVAWAYGKCVVFGYENSSAESATMMDRLKLICGGYGA